MMWIFVGTLMVGSAVPSPGRALLDRLTDPPSGLILAQSPNPEEEEDLERDMQRARRHLGHDDGTSDDEQPSVRSGTGNGKEEPQGDDGARPKKKRARKSLPRGAAGPTFDGHGKGHYLAWGIVDWGLAAGFWGAGTWFGLVGLALAGLAADTPRGQRARVDGQNGDVSYVTRRELRWMAMASGVVSVTGGVVGALLARKGGRNIGVFRELRRQGAAQIDRGDLRDVERPPALEGEESRL